MNPIRPLSSAPPVRTSELARGLLEGRDFQNLHRSVMTLVDDAASYLDGEGRAASKALAGSHSLAYSKHSLDVTTGIMNLASIALALKEVNLHRRNLEEAVADVVRLAGTARRPVDPGEGVYVPEGLVDLIGRTRALHAQMKIFISKLTAGDEPVENAVHARIDALKSALAKAGLQ